MTLFRGDPKTILFAPKCSAKIIAFIVYSFNFCRSSSDPNNFSFRLYHIDWIEQICSEYDSDSILLNLSAIKGVS